MPKFDLAMSVLGLPVWAVAAAAAVLIIVLLTAIFAVARGGWARGASLVVRFALVVIGAAILWSFFDRAELRERAAERRALDQRATELTARAVAPGSALACLDASAGDAVETACEKAVFATPETTAAAVAYVSARLALLADAVQFARHADLAYEATLVTLRQPIETDRFGIVAHVLSVRDSCTPLLCDSFALLHDAGRVQANLKERVFDGYVARYAGEWSARGPKAATPVAEGATNFTTASAPPAAPAATGAVPVSPKYDFPSAASIPAVSIMNAEPTPEVKHAPPAAAPLPPRKPQQATTTRAPARANPAPAPQQIAPAPPPPAAR